jgi:hypothetical protein
MRIHWFITLASLGLFLCFWAAYASLAWLNSYYFDAFPIDGTFQLFNPLRRLAAGQLPGHNDFQAFHGFGLILMHVPLFFLWGKDLFAAEFSRWMLPLLLYGTGMLGLFRAFGLPWAVTATLSTVLLILGGHGWFDSLLYPMVSSRGVRAFFPLAAIAGFTGLLRCCPQAFARPWPMALLGSGAVAFSLLCGLDQGIAFGLAYGMVVFLYFYTLYQAPSGSFALEFFAGDQPQIQKPFLLYVLFALILSVLGYVLVAGGDVGATLSILGYTFDVPTDQIWYFGAPPNDYIHGVRDLWVSPAKRQFVFLLLTGLAVFVGCAWMMVRRRRPAFLPEAVGWGMLLLISYGIFTPLANLGYFSPHNGQLLLFTLTILVLLFFAFGTPPVWQALQKRYATHLGLQKIFAPTGTLILWGVVLGLVWMWGAERVEADMRNTLYRIEKHFDPHPREYGGVLLSRSWSRTLKVYEEALPSPGTLITGEVWSTYAGLLEDQQGIFHPHRDYIIHALAPGGRARYLEAFNQRQPQYVTTVRNDFTRYERWLQETSWPFYETLLLNYQPITTTSHSILWRRTPDASWKRAATAPTVELALRPTSTPGRYTVSWPPESPPPPKQEAVLVLQLVYRIENPWERIPLLSKLPRIFLQVYTSQSLVLLSLPPPPYPGVWEVPVFVKNTAGETLTELGTEVSPALPGVKVALEQVQAHWVEVSPDSYQALVSGTWDAVE